MQLVIYKGGGRYGVANKNHKYIARYRDKDGEWTYVYPDDLLTTKIARHDKWLFRIVLPDGSKLVIHPDAHEVDENGQLKGGQATLRKVVNRALFGEYGFYPEGHPKAGEFWQRQGLLQSYRVKTHKKTGDRTKQPVVETVSSGRGFVGFEYRDSSVEAAFKNAYGKGLPEKIQRHQVESRAFHPETGEATVTLPEKPDLDAPEPEGKPDQPTKHGELIVNVKPITEETEEVITEPLTSEENPLDIAAAYLDLFFRMPRPGKAKTEAGVARGRAKRREHIDAEKVVGKRVIKPLPAWMVAKYKDEYELQHELSRDGRPLTTLITAGLWNYKHHDRRHQEQLTKEWDRTVTRHAMNALTPVKHLPKYKEWLREMKQRGFSALYEAADDYKANTKPTGPDARFETFANSKIMSAIYRSTKAAYGIDAEDPDSVADQGPSVVITPEEHMVLREYGPVARKIIDDALATLPDYIRETFRSRLWFDDPHTGPDESEESQYYRRRLEHDAEKRGAARTKWGRPWTRNDDVKSSVPSIADKLGNVEVELRAGEVKKLKQLDSSHQRYYLQKWYEHARQHLLSKLQTPGGEDNTDGELVKRWLAVETKLAHANRQHLTETPGRIDPAESYAKLPRIEMPIYHESKVTHLRPENLSERPDVKFFTSNVDLATKLGIMHHDLTTVPGLRHGGKAASQKRSLDRAERYHKQLQELSKYDESKLNSMHGVARAALAHAEQVGHWKQDGSWHESDGITALHNAAVEVQKARDTHDKKRMDEAIAKFSKLNDKLKRSQAYDTLRQPYVDAVTSGVHRITHDDLAEARITAHGVHDQQSAMAHLFDFEHARRSTKKSLNRFTVEDALNAYDFAMARLYVALAA
jgi:hypothetical protein